MCPHSVVLSTGTCFSEFYHHRVFNKEPSDPSSSSPARVSLFLPKKKQQQQEAKEKNQEEDQHRHLWHLYCVKITKRK